jgi:hypothetical protein
MCNSILDTDALKVVFAQLEVPGETYQLQQIVFPIESEFWNRVERLNNQQEHSQGSSDLEMLQHFKLTAEFFVYELLKPSYVTKRCHPFYCEKSKKRKLFHGGDTELELLKLHMPLSRRCITRHGVHKTLFCVHFETISWVFAFSRSKSWYNTKLLQILQFK